MPDEKGRYRTSERGGFQEPRCPTCGDTVGASWRIATTWPEDELWWLPEPAQCTRPKCVADRIVIDLRNNNPG